MATRVELRVQQGSVHLGFSRCEREPDGQYRFFLPRDCTVDLALAETEPPYAVPPEVTIFPRRFYLEKG